MLQLLAAVFCTVVSLSSQQSNSAQSMVKTNGANSVYEVNLNDNAETIPLSYCHLLTEVISQRNRAPNEPSMPCAYTFPRAIPQHCIPADKVLFSPFFILQNAKAMQRL